MPTAKRDEAREERITMEIVVDCYNEHEAWSGWWCYLDAKLAFPFPAECIRARRGSLLKVRERVTVTALLDDDEAADSLAEMQVMIEWQDRALAVPAGAARRRRRERADGRGHRRLALLGRARTAVLTIMFALNAKAPWCKWCQSAARSRDSLPPPKFVAHHVSLQRSP